MTCLFRFTIALAGWLVAITLAASPATAGAPALSEAAGRYDIDSSSLISFKVSQVGGGGISGRFGKFSGKFQLDNADIGKSVVQFTLFPESVKTGAQRIDTFLRSNAVFDTGNFQRITFRSTRITQTGDDTADVQGTLTAKGKSNTEHFTAKLTKWNRRVIGFQIHGDIYRSRYGMDVGTPIYSNVVQFDMSINGRKH